MDGFDNSFDFSKFDLSSLPPGETDSTVPVEEEKKSSSKKNKDQKYVKDNSKQNTGYAGSMSVFAPYNFVSLPQKTLFLEPESLTGHNSVPDADDTLLSGELQYYIHAETPIFIDDGMDNFYRNGDGRFAIPGSSIRGMIRSNAQILSFSSIADDVDDYALMYRDVANGLNKERYGAILGSHAVPVGKKDKKEKQKTITVLENVRAGYICNENGKYVIYGTVNDKVDPVTGKVDLKKGGRNYYYISERTIIEDYLDKKKEGKTSNFDYLVDEKQKPSLLQHKAKYFEEYKKQIGRGSKKKFVDAVKGTVNDQYMPSYFPVCYTLSKGKLSGITGPDEKNSNSGVYISSGYMQEKKVVYVVPKIDREKLVADLSKDHEKELREFQIDYKRRKNSITLERKHAYRSDKDKIQEYKDFFNLPKEGECKPVFYIYEGGRLYFGFTPRLRLYYDNTVKKGLGPNDGGEALDYAKSIFGYTYDSGSYKSRVAFSDAEVMGKAEVLRDRYVTLSEPRPTDYLSYLKQPDGKKTYNSSDFEIRGIKQYWLHKEADPGKSPGSENKNIDSCLRPLREGVCFKGKVRFHNLKPAELGLLLWSIRLEKGCSMNIGQAKAYGYGRIRFSNLELKVFKFSEAYSLSGELAADPLDKKKLEPYLEAYFEALINDLKKRSEKAEINDLKKRSEKAEINDLKKRSEIAEIKEHLSIRELLMMKNGQHLLPKHLTSYMDLEGYTAQKRERQELPLVENVYKARRK